jgi:hypothetical protein
MFNIFNAPRDYPSIYEPYMKELNFYDGGKSWLTSIEKIPVKAVHLFSIYWLHLEVHNGGFWQYFYNSASNTYPEALEGFKEIGMPKVAEILTVAASRLGPEFPYDRELRKTIVEEPSNRMDFDQEDSKFYELADTDKIFRKEPKFVQFAETYAKNT